jgi:hypothetical protein
MSVTDVSLAIVLVVVVAFIVHCPIFKPWFGFRRPPGHRGRWFE